MVKICTNRFSFLNDKLVCFVEVEDEKKKEKETSNRETKRDVDLDRESVTKKLHAVHVP